MEHVSGVSSSHFFVQEMPSKDQGHMNLLFTEVMESDGGGIVKQTGATWQNSQLCAAAAAAAAESILNQLFMPEPQFRLDGFKALHSHLDWHVGMWSVFGFMQETSVHLKPQTSGTCFSFQRRYKRKRIHVWLFSLVFLTSCPLLVFFSWTEGRISAG